MPDRILVLGTGVIGSVYALRFAKAGCAVTAVARGARLEALRKNGLRIRNAFLGDEEAADIQVVDSVPAGTGFDMIIVAVRGDQILGALSKTSDSAAPAIVVVGNNLGDYDAQADLAGRERLVLGFGAFGGYRDGGAIVYVDGRTRAKPGDMRRARTTLGVLAPIARPALDAALPAFARAGLPTSECGDMRSWLACHAALVFPLAGAMYAAGGDQARFCGTRDAILLGVRASKELFRSLRLVGYGTEPESLKRLLAMPEWLLVPLLQKRFAGEGTRIAMFGHANAAGGRGEIGAQALVLDGIARRAGAPLPSWDRLLPHLAQKPGALPLPDGSRILKYRPW